jgi:hypothetical protein
MSDTNSDSESDSVSEDCFNQGARVSIVEPKARLNAISSSLVLGMDPDHTYNNTTYSVNTVDH